MPDAATTLAMGALAQHWPWAAYKCGGIDKSRRTIRPCAGAVPHTWKRTTFASRAAREIAAQPVARIARSLPFAASAVRSPARASAQAWRSGRAGTNLQRFQHVDENAEEIEFGRHPFFIDACVKAIDLTRVDAGLRRPDAGGASFDLFEYLGSAPNGVI
jgi:hypothetical protein